METKVYRCGLCGNFCNKHGEVLSESEWHKAERDANSNDELTKETILINGDCCRHEFNY